MQIIYTFYETPAFLERWMDLFWEGWIYTDFSPLSDTPPPPKQKVNGFSLNEDSLYIWLYVPTDFQFAWCPLRINEQGYISLRSTSSVQV